MRPVAGDAFAHGTAKSLDGPRPEGIRQGTSNPKEPLPADVRQYPDAIAQALSQLRLVGVNCPYAVLLGAEAYTARWLKPAIKVTQCWSTSSAWSTTKSFGRLL